MGLYNRTVQQTLLGMKEKDIMEWEQIKTAPKDGREILVCNMNQGGVMRLIYWYRTENQWREKGNVIVCLQDTHWTLLPKTPNQRDA